jgi:hypothetical protein
MITREQGLLTWASRWCTLTAWRRDLSEVKVEISNRIHAGRLGTCFSRQQRVVIYKGDSFVDELGTVLHELAHAATIGSSHDERWQTVYSAAVAEVTGIAVTPCAYNYEVLNAAAKDAVRTWWRTSGNAAIWRMAHRKDVGHAPGHE